MEKAILLWFENIGTKAISLYDKYHIFYWIIAFSLINSAILIYKYSDSSWNMQSYFIASLEITFTTLFILLLSTLWFRSWYHVSFVPLVIGVKVASLIVFFLFLFYLFRLYTTGLSEGMFKSLFIEYIMVTYTLKLSFISGVCAVGGLIVLIGIFLIFI